MMKNDFDISTNLEDALLYKKQTLFWDLAKEMKPSLLFEKLADCIDLFEDFIRYCGDDFKTKLEPIGHYPFTSYCIYGVDDWGSYRSKLQRHIKKFDIFEIVAKEINDYAYVNFEERYKHFHDVWVVGEKKNNTLRKWNLDFSSFNEGVKLEVKDYIQFLLKKDTSKEKVQTKLADIKMIYQAWNFLYQDSLNSFLDIKYFHVQHLMTHFQQSGKNYALGTIRHFFTSTKIFINWLLEKVGSKAQNPFEKYTFRNVQAYSKGTEYIPDFVSEKLNEHLSDFPETAQRVWTILMNTGMRISEVLNLEEDCISYDEANKIHVLKYIPSKTSQSRAKNNLSTYHKIPVPDLVSELIRIQEKETNELRIETNMNKIFIQKHGVKIRLVSSKTIAEQINKVIEKLKIVKSDGTLFRYKHHMCRKTFVVDMLEKGHAISEIADYVNHLSKETTEKYYRDLKLEKIADLDSKMFEQLFEETLDDKIKELYSKEEKQSFMKEIKLGVRETPEGHGFCAKHVSFGPCIKKKCVGCKLLITGPQKLPKWYQLYQEQQEYLENLRAEFEESGVSDYEENRLYQQEANLLKIYADTIDKTEKFARRAGISIEEFKQN